MNVIIRDPAGHEVPMDWDCVPRRGETVSMSEENSFVVEEVDWSIEGNCVYVYLVEDDDDED